MNELMIIAALCAHLIVLWKVCGRQPINVYVIFEDDDDDDRELLPPMRLEGDEWKDGPAKDGEQ